MNPDEHPLTELLRAHREGDEEAFDQLVQLVYPHLRKIAGRQLAGQWQRGTLDTAGLINEAYVKLVEGAPQEYENRAHFFAVIARAMRQIMIDFARRKQSQKRGGGEQAVPLDEAMTAAEKEAEQLLELNRALETLGVDRPRLLKVVECRFFAGLSVRETADALGASTRTVERDWSEARKVLRQHLRPA